MLSVIVIVLAFLLKLLICLVLVLALLIFGLKLYFEPRTAKCRCKTDLTGKVALVTGGNSGIGLETARELARRGARVIIASRNGDKSLEAVCDIRRTTGTCNIEYLFLDLAKFSSIRQFVADFVKHNPRLDILVNNAGCAGAPKKKTADGIDLVMQINYLGPFLLTNLLLEKLKEGQPSRIVIVSSKAHEFAMFHPDDLECNSADSYWTRYANSKLCNILWAKALSRRLPAGVTVNALHPGVVLTDIFHKLPRTYKMIAQSIIGIFFKTSKEGAQTSIHLCCDPTLEHVTGEYFAECEVSEVSIEAKNDLLIDRVWERSLLLTRDKTNSDLK